MTNSGVVQLSLAPQSDVQIAVAVPGVQGPTGGAGGAPTQVQFNASGVLSGDANLTWGATTGLALGKPLSVPLGTAALPSIHPGTDTDTGAWSPAANTLAWSTSGVERIRLTSDGYVRLASGTGGIQFGGDTAAANALDDYEEGTFTPVIVGTSTAGTGTYTAQDGKYTKIGNTVFFRSTLTWTAHTGTGSIRVTGLPFVSANVRQPPLYLICGELVFSGQIIADMLNNTAGFDLYALNSGIYANGVAMDTSANFEVAGFYYVQ